MSLLLRASTRAAELSEQERKKEKGSWWKELLKQTVIKGVATPVAETISEGISGAMNRGATNAARTFAASDDIINLKRESARARQVADSILKAEDERIAGGTSVEAFHTDREVARLLKQQQDFVNTQYETKTVTGPDGKQIEKLDLPVQSSQVDDDVFRAQIVGTPAFNKKIKQVSKNWGTVVQEAKDILSSEEFAANIARGYTGGVGFADRTLRRLSALLKGQSLQERQDASTRGMLNAQWAKDIGELNLAFENYEKSKDYSGVIKAWKAVNGRKRLRASVDPQFQDKVEITQTYKVVDKHLVKLLQSKHTTDLGRTVTTSVVIENTDLFDKETGKINQSGLVKSLPNLYNIANTSFSEKGQRKFHTAANEALKLYNQKNKTNYNIVSLAKVGDMESYNMVAKIYAEMTQDYSNYKVFSKELMNAHAGVANLLVQSQTGIKTLVLAAGIIPAPVEAIMNEKFPGRIISDLSDDEIRNSPKISTYINDRNKALQEVALLTQSISTAAENTALVDGGFLIFNNTYNKHVPAPGFTEDDVEQQRRLFREGK